MLKIYGFDPSPRALKVKMCANALELDYDYVSVDLPGGQHKSEEYQSVHPAGKIPAIDDDGFVLFESNAICKYLCRKSGSALYPDALQAQARVDQWCDFVNMHIDIHYVSLLINKVFADALGIEVDQQALRERPAFLERFLPVLDDQLAKTAYLAGDSMTVADIVLLATIDPSEMIGVDIARYPKLNAWRENLRARPFYQKVHRFYGEGMGGQ